ncbi:MAG: PepSY domain-containing protein [Albidovulum sp.]
MIRLNKTTLLAALIAPGFAMAQVNPGDTLGTSEAAITAALQSQGYTVTEFEAEENQLEVEVVLDGVAFEIEISPADGTVLEVAQEDDDDHDDDHDGTSDDT